MAGAASTVATKASASASVAFKSVDARLGILDQRALRAGARLLLVAAHPRGDTLGFLEEGAVACIGREADKGEENQLWQNLSSGTGKPEKSR